MKVVELTERQRYALEHPDDRSDGRVLRPRRGCVRKEGKWASILEVTRGPNEPWVWMASVSRQRVPGSSYKLKQWKPEWIDEGHVKLEALLKDVGGEKLNYEETLSRAGYDAQEFTGLYLVRRLTAHETLLLERS